MFIKLKCNGFKFIICCLTVTVDETVVLLSIVYNCSVKQGTLVKDMANVFKV